MVRGGANALTSYIGYPQLYFTTHFVHAYDTHHRGIAVDTAVSATSQFTEHDDDTATDADTPPVHPDATMPLTEERGASSTSFSALASA